MADKKTRREFIRDTAVVAAALTAGLATAKSADAAKKSTAKILNYNPDMEYRRCGRTGLMVSAVCLGGHWKRVVRIIGGNEPQGWMTEKINRKDFRKNRYDVVKTQNRNTDYQNIKRFT